MSNANIQTTYLNIIRNTRHHGQLIRAVYAYLDATGQYFASDSENYVAAAWRLGKDEVLYAAQDRWVQLTLVQPPLGKWGR